MSHDTIKGDWKQLRGQVKEWWGNLTDDDLAKIDGNFDKLVGALQKRYGYAKERALEEVSRRVDALRDTSSHSGHSTR